jgi:DNA-binding transcriptional ArsR family regulator
LDSLDATFAALADPTRRAILARLAAGETSVSELAGPFDMSLPAVMKHLGRLERAGLMVAEKDGRVRRCRLAAQPLTEAAAWIARYGTFWEQRFDALDRFLGANAPREDPSWQSPPTSVRRSPSVRAAGTRRRASASSAPGSRRRR